MRGMDWLEASDEAKHGNRICCASMCVLRVWKFTGTQGHLGPQLGLF
jgi:hypothetical protein